MQIEFQQRLEATDNEIASLHAQVDSLLKTKQNAIETGDDVTAIKSKHEVQTLQERLEDLGIKKAAIQAKLQAYERNHKVAAKIHDEISTTWQQVGPLVDALIQAQRTVADTLAKITPLQARIGVLAAKHIQLTDESFNPPILRLPREIQFFPNVQLNPLSPWRYISEEERLTTQAKREAEEREKQLARVKLASEHAPICEKCKQKMTLRADVGRDGETGGPCSGIWTYRCVQDRVVTNEYVKETDCRK